MHPLHISMAKVLQAINKRVPIICSDAGGIPLQVQHGKNGWVVPSGDSEAVASLLLDIYQNKTTTDRDMAPKYKLDGKSDPNSIAEQFVRNFEMTMPKIHGDDGATSEDFWTVGNAVRWMLLASRLTAGDGAVEGGEEGVLGKMKVEEKLEGKGVDGENVWKMVMGDDMIEGEGELR
jgi:hypothetical protein